MRKNIVRAQSLYITLFTLTAAVAQAAPFRRFDPEGPRMIWQAVTRNWHTLITILDTMKVPIG